MLDLCYDVLGKGSSYVLKGCFCSDTGMGTSCVMLFPCDCISSKKILITRSLPFVLQSAPRSLPLQLFFKSFPARQLIFSHTASVPEIHVLRKDYQSWCSISSHPCHINPRVIWPKCPTFFLKRTSLLFLWQRLGWWQSMIMCNWLDVPQQMTPTKDWEEI